jgi:hypothetical protein
MPPKSPVRGLVMKFNPLYPPFGGNFWGALFKRTRLNRNRVEKYGMHNIIMEATALTEKKQAFPL